MTSLNKLLIIDAIGAFLSSLSALFVLVLFDGFVMLPRNWLIFAVFYPLAIMSFDILSIIKITNDLRNCVKITASLNAAFVISATCTMALGFGAFNSLGIAYLASEILIVLGILIWQLRSIGISGGTRIRS